MITPRGSTGPSPRGWMLAAGLLVLTLIVITGVELLGGHVISREFFHGEQGLVWALEFGLVGFFAMHLTRGVLSGNGRFGPYVKHGSEFRSLEESDDVYTISFERAKELLAQPKKSMRRARQAPKELKALGKHPESGEAVRILDGRYGPYVTDGTTNASVPKGMQVEAVTMEAAVELLNARAGMGGKKAKKAKSAKTARPAAKKKTAKKRAV